MPVRSLFVLDDPARLVPETDSSLALMRESCRRGQELFFCRVDDLYLTRQGARARAVRVDFAPEALSFNEKEPLDLDLSGLDLLWFRKDPPVDQHFFHATLVLDWLPPSVLQINPVSALRNHCEKLIPLHFPEFCPEMLVAARRTLLEESPGQSAPCVIKPLDDCSGRGVFLLRDEDPHRSSLIAQQTASPRFLLRQEFLSEISQGEIRVLLLDGEVLGSLRRHPASGDFRSNINAGGTVSAVGLGPLELRICREVGLWLKQRQILFAGIDLVGGKLLEVNITSASCLMEMNELYSAALEESVLDRVERLLQSRTEHGRQG